ncbi:MAG TPA: hypothetical protein VD887_12875 [Allosphingosinicella sp.]|nr:hypothetical protein [Allosphingosinicella sp.]
MLLLGQGCTARPVEPHQSLTHSEARALAPERLARRVLGDVSATLLPLPEGPRDPDDPRLEVGFLTPARFAGERGLCETDRLSIELERERPGAPMRLRRLSSQTRYLVRDAARLPRTGPYSGGEVEQEETGCAGLDPRAAFLIESPSARVAGQALRAAAAIVAGAREGRALAPLDCSSFSAPGRPADQAACIVRIGALRIESVTRIADCSGPASPTRCYSVSNDETALEIRFPLRSAAPSRIAVYEVVIVTGTVFFGRRD